MGQVLPAVAAASLVVYFGYHAVYGDRGLLAYLRVQQELAAARATAEAVAERRTRLERRVALLRPESLDPDLLDERARAVLGFGREGDVVVFVDEQRPGAAAE